MKKLVRYFLCCTLILLPCYLEAQQKKTDSLLNVLKTDKEDTIRVNTLIAVSKGYMNEGNCEQAMLYAKQAQQQAEKLGYQKGKANSYNAIGIIHWNQGGARESLENNLKALTIFTKIGDKKGIADSYNNIGVIYWNQGNYEKALENYFKSLKIAVETGNKKGIADSNNNIGIIYWNQENYEKALENHLKSLKIKEEIGDKKGIAISRCNIGLIYERWTQYEKALDNYLKALKIYEEISYKQGVATSNGNIGNIYYLQANYEKSLEAYLENLKINKEIGNPLEIATSYANIGNVYIMQDRFKESDYYLNQSLVLFKKIEYKDGVKDVYSFLSKLHDKKGNYKQAYNYHKLYSEIKDTLFNEQSSKHITELQVKYDTEKKESELQMQRLLLNKKNVLIYSLIAISVLILIIAVLLIRQMRTNANHRTIELQQKLLRLQMNPHFIFNALQTIQNYIFENQPHNSAVYLSKFAELIRLILENSREEYIALQSEIKTLEHYLELQQLRYENRFNYVIDIDQTIDVDFIAIPPMLAQPFIENAIEHGFAGKKEYGKINISFKQVDTNILFEIRDNGIGIIHSSAKKAETKNNHKSLATTITKERLNMFNKNKRNKIKFKMIDLGISKNGKTTGTTVIFSIPFKHL